MRCERLKYSVKPSPFECNEWKRDALKTVAFIFQIIGVVLPSSAHPSSKRNLRSALLLFDECVCLCLCMCHECACMRMGCLCAMFVCVRKCKRCVMLYRCSDMHAFLPPNEFCSALSFTLFLYTKLSEENMRLSVSVAYAFLFIYL